MIDRVAIIDGVAKRRSMEGHFSRLHQVGGSILLSDGGSFVGFSALCVLQGRRFKGGCGPGDQSICC
jgi:hypothetical protein